MTTNVMRMIFINCAVFVVKSVMILPLNLSATDKYLLWHFSLFYKNIELKHKSLANKSDIKRKNVTENLTVVSV